MLFNLIPRDLMSYASISFMLRLDIKKRGKTSELIIYEEEIDSFAWISPLKIYSHCRVFFEAWVAVVKISSKWNLNSWDYFLLSREELRLTFSIPYGILFNLNEPFFIPQGFFAHKEFFNFLIFITRAWSVKKNSASQKCRYCNKIYSTAEANV